MFESVQFRGIPNTIAAFNSRDCEVWSVWNKKQMLCKGTGADQLENFLKMVAQSGTKAVYTLKIYEDFQEAKQVKSNTPDDGSINFVLIDDEQYEIERKARSGPSLNERLDKIEMLLSQQEEEEEEENEPGDIVAGLLQQPEKLEQLINIGKSLLGFTSQSPAINSTIVRRIAGVETMNTNNDFERSSAQSQTSIPDGETDEQKLRRLANAIDCLEIHDPNLIEHLEKLANIAATNPKKFKGLITMLDIS